MAKSRAKKCQSVKPPAPATWSQRAADRWSSRAVQHFVDQQPAVIQVLSRSGGGSPPDYVFPDVSDRTFSQESGRITRIDYASGEYKQLSYNLDGTLASVVGVNRNGNTITKNFTYVNGIIAGVTTSVS